MPRRPPRLAEADIKRALRAFSDSGLTPRVVYHADGSTIIEPVQSCAPLPDANALDQWREQRGQS